MQRKRLTEVFPALLPLRIRQRKRLFYLGMLLDKNDYADEVSGTALPHEAFRASSLLINEKSGRDIRYQYNKVHNLKLAAATIDGLLIRPGQTFSFWQRARSADREVPYKDGLVLSGGKLVAARGGGLCQLSTLLFWLFLHTPMTAVEHTGHPSEEFPSTTPELPFGTDATISEGWLDLKVKNDTPYTFQLDITFDERCMYGRILSDAELPERYEIFNRSLSYYESVGRVFRVCTVDRRAVSKQTGQSRVRSLYTSTCEIGYPLPAGTIIEKKESMKWEKRQSR